jgi:hypothetical protein
MGFVGGDKLEDGYIVAVIVTVIVTVVFSFVPSFFRFVLFGFSVLVFDEIVFKKM